MYLVPPTHVSIHCWMRASRKDLSRWECGSRMWGLLFLAGFSYVNNQDSSSLFLVLHACFCSNLEVKNEISRYSRTGLICCSLFVYTFAHKCNHLSRWNKVNSRISISHPNAVCLIKIHWFYGDFYLWWQIFGFQQNQPIFINLEKIHFGYGNLKTFHLRLSLLLCTYPYLFSVYYLFYIMNVNMMITLYHYNEENITRSLWLLSYQYDINTMSKLQFCAGQTISL